MQITGSVFVFLLLLVFTSHLTTAKIHHLLFNDDKRPYIHLVDFGFLVEGYMQVNMTNFTFSKKEEDVQIGFSLSKGDEINEYLKTPNSCVLKKPRDSLTDVIYFIFNWKANLLDIERKGDLNNLDVCVGLVDQVDEYACYEFDANSTKLIFNNDKRNREARETTLNVVKKLTLEESNGGSEYAVAFSVHFWKPKDEGPYYLYFHNCYNYGRNVRDQVGVSFKMNIVAKNKNSYLSSGDIPNPQLYFGLAVLFFVTAVVWVYMIKTTKDQVYKIHYLMAVLVIIKSLSLLFHGVNYYFISVYGHQKELWAVVYYIMHLLKGMLLFGVIILIGTGWTFFKNFLTDRDRKLFMVIIPLQVLDNIALIIIEESEIGQKNYSTWSKLFILIDLICCAAIILPVIWSIRHLQEASQTDGKAAFNLKKLKLFRHFYILIICYIYLTRIVKYLIVFTVPFKYSYVVIIVVEVGSWLFYVLTGYKFKPASNNPYLKLALTEDDDDEMEDIVMQSGALEGVVRLNRASSAKQSNKSGDDIEEEEEIFINKEISHDLD